MDTILERQRNAHEERERLIEAQMKEILHKKNTQREQINSDHRVRGLLDRYLDVSAHSRRNIQCHEKRRISHCGNVFALEAEIDFLVLTRYLNIDKNDNHLCSHLL